MPFSRPGRVASLAGCRGWTFFSRQIQNLQLAAHHTYTGGNTFFLCHAFAEFLKRHIRLFVDLGADEVFTRFELPLGATPMR